MSAISNAFGNISAILVEMTGLMPEFVNIMIAIIPLVLIGVVLHFIRKLFTKLLELIDIS